MSNEPRVFTSESVSAGHPDKVSDRVSDAILDACLADDPGSRVACETLCTTNLIVIAGEITTNTDVDYEATAREAVRQIGYTSPDLGFAADSCEIQVRLDRQSSDISMGVTETDDHEQGRQHRLGQGNGCRRPGAELGDEIHVDHGKDRLRYGFQHHRNGKQ